ncbi:MAG: FAD-binding protein [Candidatus Bathyarchaeia archaeon]
MKIIVCIKQVPHVSELRFDYEKRTLIREGVHNEINPFDRRAITFAVESRKRYGGEAVVMTMGPPQAKDALIEAMSMGMDRSVHLLDRAFAGSDTLATSRALAAAIRNEMPVDLVFCGKYSVDAETGHVGPEVAELLDLPHVSGAIKVELGTPPNPIMVEAETDYGFQRIETQLPLLITTAERLIKPYSPTPAEVENAKSKPYLVVQAVDLGQGSLFGSEGSPTSVLEIYSAESKRKCEIIEGETIGEKVQKLTKVLTDQGLFTGWKDEETTKIMPEYSRKINGKKPFWVVAELVQGQVRPVTYELLGKGIELATKLESELCALVFGGGTGDQIRSLITHGADKVYVLKNERLSQYANDAYSNALAQTITRFAPYVVIAASTSFGRDFMPRVAARLGLGMTSDCIGLQLNDQQQLVQMKPAFGGNIVAPIISKTLPQVATIRPGILSPSEANQSRKGDIVDVELTGINPMSRVVKEEFRSDRDALRLDNADVIVAIGAGVGSPQNLSSVNELATVLDAPIATTRKVVDLGWLPSQLQVGLTGKSVGPKLYIAVAVRGAFNHMVGVGRARNVVAINNDPNAPIFKSCDYGIIGDYAEIVPLLTEELRRFKARIERNT